MSTERQAVYTIGPRFFAAEDGKAMFAYRLDAGSEIGPREATDADRAKHPQAWAEFEAGAKPAPQAEPPRGPIRFTEKPPAKAGAKGRNSA